MSIIHQSGWLCLPSLLALHPLPAKSPTLRSSPLLLTVPPRGITPGPCPSLFLVRMVAADTAQWVGLESLSEDLGCVSVPCWLHDIGKGILSEPQVFSSVKWVNNSDKYLRVFFFFNQDSKGKKDESIVNFKNIFCCSRKLIILEAFEPTSRSNKTWLILVTSVSSWFSENEFSLPPHTFNYAFNLSIQSCQVSTLVKSGGWSYGF